MPEYIYVALRDDDAVERFRVDPESGAPHERTAFPVPDGPSLLAVHPSHHTLYVGQRGAIQPGATASVAGAEFALSSYRIDPTNGDLSLSARTRVDDEPAHISVDRAGRHLLSTYYYAASSAVHPIDGSGAVGPRPSESVTSGIGAHFIATDPSNRFAFVPHIASGGRGLLALPEDRRNPLNAVVQYRFDEHHGTLAPNAPDRFAPADPIGPRHLDFHPILDVVYVVNEQGSSVTVYDLDTERGTLRERRTLSTLPDPDTPTYACAQIHVHPSGRFLYVSNRGYDTIATFAIDGATGDLTPTGWAEAEGVPRAFGLTSDGGALYAAALETGVLHGFRVDPRSGALEALGSVDVGKRPMWVLCVGLPD